LPPPGAPISIQLNARDSPQHHHRTEQAEQGSLFFDAWDSGDKRDAHHQEYPRQVTEMAVQIRRDQCLVDISGPPEHAFGAGGKRHKAGYCNDTLQQSSFDGARV